MKNIDKAFANPSVLLREEFDDWAVLFDADTGRGFGLNPTGVYVWKLLDGKHSTHEILLALQREGEGVTEDASAHIEAFIEALVAKGLAGAPVQGFCIEESFHLLAEWIERNQKLPYEAPQLVYLGGGHEALGACTSHGSVGGDCNTTGAGAVGCCLSTGTCAMTTITGCCYTTGACAVNQCCAYGNATSTGACTNGNKAGAAQCATGGHP